MGGQAKSAFEKAAQASSNEYGLPAAALTTVPNASGRLENPDEINRSRFIGLGVGIDSPDAIGLTTRAKPRQHSNDAVETLAGVGIRPARQCAAFEGRFSICSCPKGMAVRSIPTLPPSQTTSTPVPDNETSYDNSRRITSSS
jgi:hypothetical protein